LQDARDVAPPERYVEHDQAGRDDGGEAKEQDSEDA
jgi:hypothetical protein